VWHAAPAEHRLCGGLATFNRAQTSLKDCLAHTLRILDRYYRVLDSYHFEAARGTHDYDFISNVHHTEAPVECRIILGDWSQSKGLRVALRCRISVRMIG